MPYVPVHGVRSERLAACSIQISGLYINAGAGVGLVRDKRMDGLSMSREWY